MTERGDTRSGARPVRLPKQPRLVGPAAPIPLKLVKVVGLGGTTLTVQPLKLILSAGIAFPVPDGVTATMYPWPGYPTSYYANKSSIVMIAVQFNDLWIVCMTGDRFYGNWPASLCSECPV